MEESGAASGTQLASQLRSEALALGGCERLWPAVARRLTGFFGCERVTIFERLPNETLVSRYAHGLSAPIRLAPGEGIAGWAAKTGRSHLSNNPYADPLFYQAADQATSFTTRNMIAYPLWDGGRTAGVLELINKPGGFTRQDLAHLDEIGSDVAMLFGKTKAEEEQARLSEKLALAEKMAALGRLSGAVAHEVNNPLMAVLGILDVTLRAPGLPEEALKNLLKVDSEIRRIRLIVSDLLDFTRSGAVVKKPVNLSSAVEESLALVEVELRHRGIELKRRCESGLPPAVCDPNQLKQIILNLVLNAMQALEGRQGEVTVSTLRLPKGEVAVRVADDGPGVPADIRDRIFEPFFTTKGEKGTGLGLSVSMGLAKANDGRLTLEAGPGAVFQIALSTPASSTLE